MFVFYECDALDAEPTGANLTVRNTDDDVVLQASHVSAGPFCGRDKGQAGRDPHQPAVRRMITATRHGEIRKTRQ